MILIPTTLPGNISQYQHITCRPTYGLTNIPIVDYSVMVFFIEMVSIARHHLV